MGRASTDSAIRAIQAGQYSVARGLLRQVLREDPDDAQAWFWLARAVESEPDRIACLRQVLRLDPDHQAAKAALTHLGAHIPPSSEAGTLPVPAEQPAPEALPTARGEPEAGSQAAVTPRPGEAGSPPTPAAQPAEEGLSAALEEPEADRHDIGTPPPKQRTPRVAIAHQDWTLERERATHGGWRRNLPRLAVRLAAVAAAALVLAVLLSPAVRERLGLPVASPYDLGLPTDSPFAPTAPALSPTAPTEPTRSPAAGLPAPTATGLLAAPSPAPSTATPLPTTTAAATAGSSPTEAAGSPPPSVSPTPEVAPSAEAPLCTLRTLQAVRAYQRPGRQGAAFTTVAAGRNFPVVGRTEDGWLGIDPGLGREAGTGIFRLRWMLREAAIQLSGDCSELPVLVGPPLGVCFAIAADAAAVHLEPDAESKVVARLESGAYAAVTAMAGSWAHLDLRVGSAGLEIWGWIEAGAVELDGPCDALPDLPTAVDIGVDAGEGSVYHPGEPMHICYVPSRPFTLRITICRPDQRCTVSAEIVDAAGDGGCLPWDVVLPAGKVVVRIEALEQGRVVAKDETFFFVEP